MAIRTKIISAAACLLLFGCGEQQTGPLIVSAIGGAPKLVNPNLSLLDAPSTALLGATAQGLVRFDAAGQIEPALSQSWIVSDDGLRYTFRLIRTQWDDGSPVTAEQVAARLRAAFSPASRNPAKPLLGVIDEVVAMTDEVLEISLKAPRPAFLQLLAQPELAITRANQGSGPYEVSNGTDGSLLLQQPPPADDEEESLDNVLPPILLRGEPAPLAIARFAEKQADLVTGGTVGDLPIVRASQPPAAALIFDPVAGLFGLRFNRINGILGNPSARAALNMAIDRAAIVAALDVPDLQPRESLVPVGVEELPQPALPEWTAAAVPMRRQMAAQTIAALAEGVTPNLRIGVPAGPGYRLIFAHLRRDWRAIGVSAEAVPEDDSTADLRLVDSLAPIGLASWYLRHFTCQSSRICVKEADTAMEAARTARLVPERRLHLANADRLLAQTTPFIPLTAPVRWSLVSPRLTGFRANPFGRHSLSELIATRR